MNSSTTQRRRQNRPRRQHAVRLPKSLTANAPFQIGKNKQLISVPSHTDGLTIRRAVRLTNAVALSDFPISYLTCFNRFLGELNITLQPTGRLSFSPEWVSVYLLSNTLNSLAVRIFDEPRSNATAGAFVNTPFFEVVDSASSAGISSIKAIIPKAATYSISADDPANMLGLPFISLQAIQAGQIVVDIGGTWTIKNISGPSLSLDSVSIG